VGKFKNIKAVVDLSRARYYNYNRTNVPVRWGDYMINKDRIIELIKAQLPQVSNEVIETIAANIIQDVEAVIHSMVRQATSQEKENQYWKNNKK
jgi:hypothetical protein